jgi:PTH1 family peptidyl-tRNA hydrolase
VLFVIAGLGNPGAAYRASRHNAGYDVVERLARRHGLRLRPGRFEAESAGGCIAGCEVRLLRPLTYMNLSGRAVAPACRRLGVPAERLAVIQDDIDLELGRIQVRRGGGDGGHRGIRSVIAELGTADFVRLRLGVGRPAVAAAARDHVLGGFAEHEREPYARLLERAADAVTVWLADGLQAAMNRFNPWRRPAAATRAEGPAEKNDGDERQVSNAKAAAGRETDEQEDSPPAGERPEQPER